MASQIVDEKPELTKNRIEALADAVFAIAMTILVVGVEVPDLPPGSGRQQLIVKLIELWPRLHVYFVSFLILGVYWVIHDVQFRVIKHSDRVLLWINIFILMFVALTPFSTELFGKYHAEQAAVFVYAANIIVVALLFYVHWWYATKGRRLVDENIDPRFIGLVSVQILISAAISLAAVALSFVQAELSKFIFLLIPVVYISMRLIARRHRGRGPGNSNQ